MSGSTPAKPGPIRHARPYWIHVLLNHKILWRLLQTTYLEWSTDKAARMGAALAYYATFSLTPLLIIVIAVAGFVFGDKAAQGAIVDQIQGLFGRDNAKTVQSMIQSAHRPAAGVAATAVGVVVLLFGASGAFAEIQDALNTIWEVKANPKSGVWQFIKDRFLSFGMVLGTGFLLLLSLLLSTVATAMTKLWGDFLPISPLVLHGADIVVSFAMTMALFAMIFKVLPDITVSWNDVWVGAGMTSVLFTIGKFLIGFYIGRSISASSYGAAGSLVIVIAWVYYSAQILYFGAEFTRVFAKERGSILIPENGATIAPKPKEEARI